MDLVNLQDEVLNGFTVTAARKRINLVYLDLLQEFDRLCRANDINYFVFFGTLLGAVRHQGFIPWDDDVDIMMPRESFDRLMNMTNEQFGAKPPYFLQTMKTDPDYARYLIRFRRSDTTCIMPEDYILLKEHPKRAHYNMGLNLSVFPMDDVPSTPAAFARRKKIAYLLMGIEYRASQPKREKPLQHKICAAARGLMGGRFFVRSVYRCYRIRKTTSPMTTCLDGFYPDPHYWHREDFRDAVWLPFENITVRAPIGYDRLLRDRYGDYMQFPPAVERKEKHDCFMSADVPYAQVTADPDSIPMEVDFM